MSKDAPSRLDLGDRSDGSVSTALTWIGVYQELLRFVERALARAGVEDMAKLAEARRRFLRRHQFWSAELRRTRGRDG